MSQESTNPVFVKLQPAAHAPIVNLVTGCDTAATFAAAQAVANVYLAKINAILLSTDDVQAAYVACKPIVSAGRKAVAAAIANA